MTHVYLLQLTADPDSNGEQIIRAFHTEASARDALDRHLVEIDADAGHQRTANTGVISTDEGDLQWDIFRVVVEGDHR